MKTFKEFLILSEAVTGNYLTPTDIYDFYFLTTAFSYDKINSEDTKVAEFYLNEICNLYLTTFKELLIKQIEKYYKKGRVDQDFKMSFNYGDIFKSIKDVMAKTFRSDMERRNDVWNVIADHLYSLSRAFNLKNKCYFIDRINNSVHNTGDIVLDKFKNGRELITAFDNVHHSENPRFFARFVSPEIRKLIKIW